MSDSFSRISRNEWNNMVQELRETTEQPTKEDARNLLQQSEFGDPERDRLVNKLVKEAKSSKKQSK